MSSKKSRKSKLSDSDSDSGPEDRNPPAKKAKNEKGATSTAPAASDDGSYKFSLSKNRNVCVREFRGKVLVDIREFYEKDGQTLPTKKGISLSLEQWNTLKEHMESIEAAIKKF